MGAADILGMMEKKEGGLLPVFKLGNCIAAAPRTSREPDVSAPSTRLTGRGSPKSQGWAFRYIAWQIDTSFGLFELTFLPNLILQVSGA